MSKLSSPARNSSTASRCIWAIILMYCSVAFLPAILGAGTGLDPSWMYGLSYASMQHLVFGKDIVFTYGPFGYLVGGAALEENFFSIYSFRLLIHILFFTSIFFQLIQCKTLIQKLVLFSATIFLSLILGLNGQTEYKIVLLALICSSNKGIWESKHLRKWSLCLGCLSGLALLSKFTIGFSVFVIFLICLSVTCYHSIKSKRSIKRHIFAIANFLVATASTLIVFLYPERKQGFLIIFSCFALAGCISLSASAASFLYELILSKLSSKSSKHQDSLKINGISSQKSFGDECSFYLAYGVGLVVIALYFCPSAVAYLQGCLEISSGYSSAMVVVGSEVELGCAIAIILLILISLSLSFKSEDLALPLCLGWVLFLIFKHGFVRADGHVAIFASLSPFLIAFCFKETTRKAAQTTCFWGYLCILVIIMFGFSVKNIGLPGNKLTQILAPESVLNRLIEWSNPLQYKVKIAEKSDAQLSSVKFPAELRNLIGNRSVDIIPSEISLIAANNLNWKPRPTFQSYAAYTRLLDDINFLSLSKKNRDYIIYSFNSIDGRHPFFDEPKTFFNLFCNYSFLSKFPDSILKPNAKFVLLERRPSDICLPDSVQPPKALEWNVNEVLEPRKQTIVLASIEFRYSFLGKIYKTLFRAPPVKIWINYVDGSKSEYRMVLDNAVNGIMISHLAKNDQEALLLFNNVLLSQVKSFSLRTNNPLIYQKTIKLQLFLYSQSIEFVDPPAFVNLARLKGVNFLTTATADAVGSLDSVKISRSQKTLSLAGWAARRGQEVTDPVWLLITDGAEHKPVGILKTGESRPDVAQFLHQSNYALSGWSGTLDASEFTPGEHVVKVWFFKPDVNSAILLAKRSINVK